MKPDRSGAVANSRKLFATPADDSVVSFRMGPDGAMYMAAHAQGSVKRIAPKTIPAACSAAVAPPPDGGAGRAGPGAPGRAASGTGGGGTGGADRGRSGGCRRVPAAAGAAGRGGTGGTTAGTGDDGGCGCDLGGAGSGRRSAGRRACWSWGRWSCAGRRRRRR